MITNVRLIDGCISRCSLTGKLVDATIPFADADGEATNVIKVIGVSTCFFLTSIFGDMVMLGKQESEEDDWVGDLTAACIG